MLAGFVAKARQELPVFWGVFCVFCFVLTVSDYTFHSKILTLYLKDSQPWGCLVAQWVRDLALALQQLGSLLWQKFDP